MDAIVRVRGDVNVRPSVKATLEMLNLHHVNHCVFVPDSDTYGGMVSKVNDYVAYGEPSGDIVAELIRRRAEPENGAGAITDEWVADNTPYRDIQALAEALLADETTLRAHGVSPVLRLHPPRGGHDGIKHPVKEGGELGKHSQRGIDDLLEAMR